MWSSLSFDILANIFSFLAPDSLALAGSACRHWHACAKAHPLTTIPSEARHQPPWFIALPVRNRGPSCYVRSPVLNNWREISLDFLPKPVRLISPVGSLLLCRSTASTSLKFNICNPFTRQYRRLPLPNTTRTNPAVGLVELGPSPNAPFPQFRVYVAGGLSEAPCGGATYEPTLEIYDSKWNNWQIVETMPAEFAVRLTVWTPNESVFSDGLLYWMTSARAYSVMGLQIGTNTWRELSVPMADRLEFAALVRRNGRLTLVGGACGGSACIWELEGGENWVLVEKLQNELALRFLGGKANWGSTKCAWNDEAVCLYRDLGSGMLAWRIVEKGKWEWFWVEGCRSIRGKQVQNFTIRGVLLHPNLASSSFLLNSEQTSSKD